MWSKIIDPRISHRWFLRAVTGCKLGPTLRSLEVQISNSPNGRHYRNMTVIIINAVLNLGNKIRLFTNWWSAITVQISATAIEHVSW